ncbi:MAG: c-type cytochrome [Candidatus Omnitrophica bacterium]|nr:c-type cytochrome [Candidatus Omnitrophota bacterium]
MAKPTPTLYSIAKTFMWFAIISLLLLGSLVAIVLMDHSREWKVWQKKFVAIKTERAKKELAEAEAKVDKKQLATLAERLKQTQMERKSQRAEMAKTRKELEALEVRFAQAKTHYQDQKQFQDSYRYYFEEYSTHHDPRAKEFQKKFQTISPKVAAAKKEQDDAEKLRDEKAAQLEDFSAKEKEVKKEIEKLLAEKRLVQGKLDRVKPTLAKDILNAPMLDFLKPSLQVQQIVLEDLYDDYHFAKTQKVDRCTTCHQGIDQKGFEDMPQPFRTHPDLDLYLGSQSPHPVEKFGCTVCHSGSGHSVSFTDAAHTPSGPEEARQWKKKYGWHDLEKWEQKMLPLEHAQASCAKCHNDVVEVPQADHLNEGRRLAAKFGCFNCHKINGFEERWKVGPDLTHLSGKVDEDWITRWLHDPKAFRPSTQMPQIFHLSNHQDAADRERDNAAIAAITAYLVKNSEPITLMAAPIPGNPEEGEKLVKSLGCLGCHSVGDAKGDSFGPELSNLGSKVGADWLFTWIKDPKHYSSHTRMPNLRLSDPEAAHITAYLLSQRNESFEKTSIPEVMPEVVDSLILESFQGAMRAQEARAKLDQMNADERLEFLGKKSIAHQGCFTCHAIKGFEDQKPIGADLSNEGRKDIHQLDFGFVPIEHSREAFIEQKLKDPRIFDRGKIRSYYEKLRMPQFNFTDAEIESLTTFVLSLTEEQVPLQMRKRLDLKEERVEEGRLLVAQFNCNGCHTFDGKNGTLRELTEDPGAAPPVLDGEGAKVQEKWLHEFLRQPTVIRPWLTYRMPTFGLNEKDTQALVEYFANLSHEEASYKGHPVPETTPEKLAAGQTIFNQFQCVKCHQLDASSAAMGASFLAPDLSLTKKRLKPNWVKAWIQNPEALQAGTMMPSFFVDGQTPLTEILGGDAQAQIEAIRDYLYHENGVAKA